MTTVVYATFILSLMALSIAGYYAYKEIMKDLENDPPEIKPNKDAGVREEEIFQLSKSKLQELIRQEIKKELSRGKGGVEFEKTPN